MSEGFERISRSLGRRSLLKAVGAGALLVVTRPFRATAQEPCVAGTTPCGETCCPSGVACLDPATSRCGCPPGSQSCGSGCCESRCYCSLPDVCCCGPGSTACGPTCCKAGIACLNRTSGVCGCPAGKTQCVTHNPDGSIASVSCCDRGRPCGHSSCVQQAQNPEAAGDTNIGCGRGYADPCEVNEQCCTGFCSSQKGNRCGCRYDSDCGRGGRCDRESGICNQNNDT